VMFIVVGLGEDAVFSRVDAVASVPLCSLVSRADIPDAANLVGIATDEVIWANTREGAYTLSIPGKSKMTEGSGKNIPYLLLTASMSRQILP